MMPPAEVQICSLDSDDFRSNVAVAVLGGEIVVMVAEDEWLIDSRIWVFIKEIKGSWRSELTVTAEIYTMLQAETIRTPIFRPYHGERYTFRDETLAADFLLELGHYGYHIPSGVVDAVRRLNLQPHS